MTVLESVGVAAFIVLVVFAVLVLLYVFLKVFGLILAKKDETDDVTDYVKE